MTSRPFVLDLAAAVALVLVGLIASPGPAVLLVGALVVILALAVLALVGRLPRPRRRASRRRPRRG